MRPLLAGVFLSWLRASDESGALVKKKPFHNTFVPTVAPPLRSDNHAPLSPPRSTTSSAATAPEDRVKDHHLDDEIHARLTELQLLERDFKVAERVVHGGTPTFDKMKQFLVALTLLRSKEDETRRFLLKHNAVLTQQHREMRAETLHTRAQLDFFVDGFANLRQRHDALLETSTQLQAESEVTQELFLAMSAHDSHFATIMAHTLTDQRQQNAALQARLDTALERIRVLETRQTELLGTISALKSARGDAQKDAHCYKRQLRVCKRKMAAMEQAAADCSVFRAQAAALRQSFANLLTYVRDAVVRDTKTPKQAMSKEALRIIQHALGTSAVAPSLPASSPSPQLPVAALLGSAARSRATPEDSSSDALDTLGSPQSAPEVQDAPSATAAEVAVPHVVTKRVETQRDLDEAVRGVLLLGGADDESATCAKLLSSTLRYAPVNVREALVRFEATERDARQQQQQLANAEALASAPTALASQGLEVSSPVVDRPLQIASYSAELKQHILAVMEARGARGFVLFNWEFTSRDVNLLLALGLPVDSVLDLGTPAPQTLTAPRVLPPQLVQPAEVEAAPLSSPPPQSSRKQPVSPTRSQVGAKTPASSPAKPASVRAPSASAKKPAAAPTIVAANSPAKATAASPSRGTARPTASKASETASTSRRAVETPSKTSQQQQQKQPPSAVGKRPSGTPPSIPPASTLSSAKPPSTASSSPEKPKPKPKAAGAETVDRKTLFKGMLYLYERVEAASFPEERVQRIVETLTQQCAKRSATTRVQWDESTQRTNELLAMFAEDVHTMLFIEQENRKPKKPGSGDSPASSSRTTPSSSSAAKPGGGSTSRSSSPTRGALSPAKQSTARGSSRSPTKPTATARGSGAAAVATSRRATAAAVSPTARRAPTASASGATAVSDKSKRASVATSSPTAKHSLATSPPRGGPAKARK